MPALIPAYIMIPEEGTSVLCYGIDAMEQPFAALPGRRINGQWTLDDRLPFKQVTHWVPVSLALPERQGIPVARR